MLLVRKISCTKCKFRNGSDEHHIYACNFEKCRMRDNVVEILDTDDGKVETYSIDELKNYLYDGIEVDNVDFEDDNSMTILR